MIVDDAAHLVLVKDTILYAVSTGRSGQVGCEEQVIRTYVLARDTQRYTQYDARLDTTIPRGIKMRRKAARGIINTTCTYEVYSLSDPILYLRRTQHVLRNDMQ